MKESFGPKFEHEDRIIRNETHCVVQKIDKDVEVIHETMKRNEENIIAQNEDGERERLKKLLIWLSELDVASKHRLMLENYQPGTGDWLLKHEKFQSWYIGTETAMLWCSGNRKLIRAFILRIGILIFSFSWCWKIGNDVSQLFLLINKELSLIPKGPWSSITLERQH